MGKKKVTAEQDVLIVRVDPVGKGLYHVVCEGEIAVSTSPHFKEVLNKQIDAPTACSLIINLEKVWYVDSTGFVAMISALKRVREHDGTIVLICTNPKLLKILTIIGLVNVFQICETLDEARKSYAK